MRLKDFKLALKQSLAPFFAPLYRGRGTILMFHRVLPDDGKPRVHTKALEVTPERLEEIILFFKSENYDFIKMEAVESYLIQKRKNRFVVFTFDDGYIDNYTVAYPIFKKYNIPFTIYITTDFPDYKHLLWNYMLEDWILNNSKLELKIHDEVQSFELNNAEQKENVYNELRRFLIDLSVDKRREKIKEWFLDREGDLTARVKNESMTWQQIIELSNDPLVEIGAHTVSHPSLATLSEDEILMEVNGSSKRIEEMTKKRPIHFAYPFGSKNEIRNIEVDALCKTPFRTSVTTREANIMKEHKDYLHALPRIYVGPKKSIFELKLDIRGKTNFIKNSKIRLVTV